MNAVNMNMWNINVTSCINSLFSSGVSEITKMFWENNYIYIVLFVVAILLITKQRKQLGNGYNLLFSYTILVFILVIYNPVTRMFVSAIPVTITPIYARLYMLLPMWVIIAYGLALLNKRKQTSFISIALLAATMILAGNSLELNSMLVDSNNMNKVNSDAVLIADTIMNINDGKPTSLWIILPEINNEEKYIYGGTIGDGIKQYTANIRLSKWYYDEEYWNDFFVSDDVSADYIGSIIDNTLKQQGVEYIAIPDDESVAGKMSILGYEVLGHECGYYFYKIQ